MECICGGKVYRTDWIEPESWEGLRCRIWMRTTPFGIFQRHEWQKPGQNDTTIDEWIPTPLKEIKPHYREVESDEGQSPGACCSA